MKLSRDLQRDILARAGLSKPARKRSPKAPAWPLPPEGSPVMGLDPSGECCGWAVVSADGIPADWGVIRPPASCDTLGARARFIGNVVTGLCERYRPGLAVVEVCSGHCYREERRHSLAPLAFVQGAAFRAVEQAGVRAVEVDEKRWTGGKPKTDRAAILHAVFAEFGRWAKQGDPGLDATDSVGIAEWYLRQIKATV